MFSRKILVQIFIACILFLLSFSALFAQSSSSDSNPATASLNSDKCSELKDMADDISGLANLKGKLTIEIPQIEEDIKKLNLRFEKAKPASEAEKENNDNAAEKKKIEDELKAATDADQKDVLQYRLDYLSNVVIESQETVKAELAKKQEELKKKEAQISCIQDYLTSAYTPAQKFKSDVSKYGMILIGIVIIGFFVLAGLDVQIRRAIFSGQSGIQFLTLFSIVIAIILFGIAGILQDKELAALLGGLSGYILGKYNQDKPDAGQPAHVTPPPPANNPPASPPFG